MKNLIIKMLERVPRTRWWTRRLRRERTRWIDTLERLRRFQSDRQTWNAGFWAGRT